LILSLETNQVEDLREKKGFDLVRVTLLVDCSEILYYKTLLSLERRSLFSLSLLSMKGFEVSAMTPVIQRFATLFFVLIRTD